MTSDELAYQAKIARKQEQFDMDVANWVREVANTPKMLDEFALDMKIIENLREFGPCICWLECSFGNLLDIVHVARESIAAEAVKTEEANHA